MKRKVIKRGFMKKAAVISFAFVLLSAGATDARAAVNEMQENTLEQEESVTPHDAAEDNVSQSDTRSATGTPDSDKSDDIIRNDETGIPDKNLYDAVLARCDSNEDGVLTKAEAESAEWLELLDSGISNLQGIQYFKTLTWLELADNQISDISALTSLTNLEYLSLADNQISDISALMSLTNLEYLFLNGNQISDISVLSSLINLCWLSLHDNQISDISALTSLTNLYYVELYRNQISGISALTPLTNLEHLYLDDNQISDISALSSLTNLLSLSLSDNQISDISALTPLTNLENLYLYGNQISDISALSSLTNLLTLNLSDNQISDISALSSLTNLFDLSLVGDQISDISVLSKLPNLKYLYLNDEYINEIDAIGEQAPEESPNTPDITAPTGPVSLPDQKIAEASAEVTSAGNGTAVTVAMGDATVVPKGILEAAKGKDVDVVLQMDGYFWTINGKDILSSNLKDINLKVIRNTEYIPSSRISQLAGTNPVEQITLEYEGDFGFTADLTMNIGSQYAGKTGNLYWHDSDGRMIFMNAGAIDGVGNVTLGFSHASDYAIVITDSEAATAPNTAAASVATPAAVAPKTGDELPVVPYAVLCMIGLTGLLTAGVAVKRRRTK